MRSLWGNGFRLDHCVFDDFTREILTDHVHQPLSGFAVLLLEAPVGQSVDAGAPAAGYSLVFDENVDVESLETLLTT
jgi:hypothetical protein